MRCCQPTHCSTRNAPRTLCAAALQRLARWFPSLPPPLLLSLFVALPAQLSPCLVGAMRRLRRVWRRVLLRWHPRPCGGGPLHTPLPLAAPACHRTPHGVLQPVASFLCSTSPPRQRCAPSPCHTRARRGSRVGALGGGRAPPVVQCEPPAPALARLPHARRQLLTPARCVPLPASPVSRVSNSPSFVVLVILVSPSPCAACLWSPS